MADLQHCSCPISPIGVILGVYWGYKGKENGSYRGYRVYIRLYSAALSLFRVRKEASNRRIVAFRGFWALSTEPP